MHDHITRIDAAGELERIAPGSDWRRVLAEGEAVHRELRPAMSPDYLQDMHEVFSTGGHVTQFFDDGEVRGLALWRVFRTTYAGLRLEIDDLVTASAQRSRGYGAALLRWLAAKAEELGCQIITLNSANHRVEAHRFYEREGFGRFGVHFSKPIGHPVQST